MVTIPITTRATQPFGSRLHVVPSHGARRVQHELPMPVAACPVSRNPLSGTVRVWYTPRGHVVEVVSLHAALAWACSGVDGAPRSVEELAAWLRTQCAAAVGAKVRVTLDLLVQPGPQRLRVTA